MLKNLPRGVLQDAAQRHQGQRYVKKFGCWEHVVVMVYAQLGSASSLRTLEAGFNQHRNHHYHLGVGPVSRSTLSDANRRRNPELFAQVLRALIAQAGRAVRTHKQELLYLLDSTSIPLRGRGFDWAEASATRTPGLKVHLLYDSAGQVPAHQTITPANVNDIDEGRRLPICQGATYVFDKGYCDYNWWARIDAAQARFVTRLKTNAAVRVLQPHPVAQADGLQILNDSTICFANKSCRGGHRNEYAKPLRRIEVARPDSQPLVLVTNDLRAPAGQIAGLYKQRWEIELFFKWIKQHLRIKRFLGRSENAIRIQLLTALIAYLLVVILRKTTASPRSLWLFLAELQAGLFHRCQNELSRWRRTKHSLSRFQALQPELFT